MKTKLIGMIASIALMGSGAALAGGDWKQHEKQQQQTQSQGATGGSGQVITHEGTSSQTGSSGQMNQGGSGQMNQGGSGTLGQGSAAQQGSTQQLGSNEIIGRVVKSSKKMVWVEHAGAIVPLTIDKQTQFNDTNVKRAQDFQEGDQIRASFEVRKTDNVATSIQKSDSNLGGSGSNLGTGSGTGGSGSSGMGSDIDQGSDVLTPDTIHNPDSLPPSQINNGTGGSGTLNPPDVSDEGTSSDLGSDTSKGTTDY